MTTLSPLRSTILIVDDVPENITILLNMLRDDYDLQYATSGHQALSLLAKAKKPDLILLDAMMPMMDGYEVCSALKLDAATSHIPVIFITAKTGVESETQALAAGAVDFIHKPINREVLCARVKVHLETEQRVKALHLANTELTEWNSNLKSRVIQQTALVRQKVEEAHQRNARKQKESDVVGSPAKTPPPTPDKPLSDRPLTILCVDDEQNILNALTRLFHGEPFQVVTASSGKEGLAILEKSNNIGLILSDHRMPEMSGTDFLQAAATVSPDSSKMILTGHADMNTVIGAINQGGIICLLTKPWKDQELLETVRGGLQRYQLAKENRREKEELAAWNSNLKSRLLQQTALVRQKVEEANQQNDQKTKSTEDIVFLLADLLDKRHRRLSAHSRTVAELATSMVKQLRLPQSRSEEIRHAALLHDIGLIGVSDRLLANNMEFLTTTDTAEYRTHPVKGQELVDTFEELRGIGLLIRHHHEAFDGSGFPDGLAGGEISLGGQIIHLASFIESSFTQLTGDDAKYKVSRKVAACMGTLFDPTLLAAAGVAIREILTA